MAIFRALRDGGMDRAVKYAALALSIPILVLGLLSWMASPAGAVACSAGARAFAVESMTLCVPEGSDGYTIRAAGPSLLKFEEQYFVGTTRVTDVDPRTSKRPDGTKATAVLTSIRSKAVREIYETSLRGALHHHNASLRTGQPVTIYLDVAFYGEITVEFVMREDGRFEGRTLAANPNLMPIEYWLAAMSEDGSVEYVLSCSASGKADRLLYACSGDFNVGAAVAMVSLFAPETAALDDSFEANRSIILSFVAP